MAGSAIGLIVIFSDAVWAVWVGTFIFGLGMAASFPTAFTMLSEQVGGPCCDCAVWCLMLWLCCGYAMAMAVVVAVAVTDCAFD